MTFILGESTHPERKITGSPRIKVLKILWKLGFLGGRRQVDGWGRQEQEDIQIGDVSGRTTVLPPCLLQEDGPTRRRGSTWIF